MPLTIRKRGKNYQARGTIPARQEDGSIQRIFLEESLRTESKSEARKRASDLERHYHELAYKPEKTRTRLTFAQAALTYLQTRGKYDRFLPKLLTHFGDMSVDQIDQAAIANAAHALYPGRSGSTHNRAVYAPVVTILRLAGHCPVIKRPRSDRPRISVPTEAWFDSIIPLCQPRLAALLVFITLTGRRIGEALEATWNEDGRTASIRRTKAGAPVVVAIPEFCLGIIGGQRNGERLFPWWGSRYAVRTAIKRVCERNNLPYYGTHAIGRHAFATRLLREGKSLQFVKDAGGWASIKMPAQHYSHLEKSEVQDQVREIQDRWSKKRTL